MFWDPGHQQSSEGANQPLEVGSCTIFDRLLFDVTPMQAPLGFHRKDTDCPCPVPILLPNTCTHSP